VTGIKQYSGLPARDGKQSALATMAGGLMLRVSKEEGRSSGIDALMRQRAYWAFAAGFLFMGAVSSRAAGPNEIFQRATAAFRSDWAADPSYAYIEKDEVQKGDKLTSKTFEVVMIDGSDYRLPLAIDGQPVSPARRKAELIKLKDEAEHRRNESPSARRSRIAAWKKQRDENGELLLDFPTSLTFQLQGEAIRDGHAAFIFSATPKPGVVATTRAAKVLTGMQGTAWVDKDSLHPIRVECNVVRPVPVYGALASVLPGTDIEITMTKVSDSTWLIDLVSLKLKIAKILLFKSEVLTRYTYSDYRPNDSVLQELLKEASQG
jgi:hypothetical protein